MKDHTTAERLGEAIINYDIEGIKKIRQEIVQDQWLNQWRGKSIPIEAWLDDNPFIKWVDTPK